MILALLACAEPLNECEGWGSSTIAGSLENDDLDELSGLVASEQHGGWLWGHNDGDEARLYALEDDGEDGGRWVLASVEVSDLEDVARTADHRLVLGDIGDNKRKRTSVQVLAFPEPDPEVGGGTITDIEVVTLSYPGERRDAEALLVDPTDGALYLLTKGATSTLFRAPWEGGEMTEVITLDPHQWRIDGDTHVTAADVSPDGKVLLRMRDHVLAWNLAEEGLGSTFQGTACRVEPAAEAQGESLAATAAGFYTASEGRGVSLHEYTRR